MITRRTLGAGAAALGLVAGRRARAQAQPLKIGVLTDMTGALSAVLGQGSVEGAKLAIEDFGGSAAGMPVQLLFADHQNKPDVASNVARKWIDEDGVSLEMDLGSSAAALAVQNIVRDKNRIAIITGAATSEITGRSCNRNTFHWGYDTYMQSAAVAAELTRRGGDSWFFLTADYAYGHTLEADARRQIEANGGRVVGSVRHPANTHDMSSFLLQAQGSRAKMIGIASAGDDMERAVRQGGEFGLWRQQQAVAFGMQLYNVPSVGVAAMRGILHNSIFYWDRTEATRAFSKRLRAILGKPPAETHAVNYSAAGAYLRAVQAAGTKEAEPVLAALRAMKVDDVVTPGGQVRADGRLVRPTFLLEVKAPDQVKETWDVFTVKGEIPGDVAFRSPADSACPLLRG
jgi:branched-chain amino acid transport system substrate-binding protein